MERRVMMFDDNIRLAPHRHALSYPMYNPNHLPVT